MIVFAEGTDYIVPLSISANPSAAMLTKVDSESAIVSITVSNSNLVFNQLSVADAGSYDIIVQNEAGLTNTSFILVVECKFCCLLLHEISGHITENIGKGFIPIN